MTYPSSGYPSSAYIGIKPRNIQPMEQPGLLARMWAWIGGK